MMFPVVGSDGANILRSLESGGPFSVGAYGRTLAPLAMKMFSNLI
jgi:hypothetical protein